MTTPGSNDRESEEIELFCWVTGDDPNNIFPIQIETKTTIGDLKDKIKDRNKHTFQHVDAKSLVLWKVCVPLHRINEHSLNNLLSQDGLESSQKLVPWEVLSHDFPSQPSLGRLHIVVQLPRTPKITTFLRILRSTAFRGAVFNIIPWFAALYYVMKSTQASAAQAYASLRQDNTPEFIVGYRSNVSTSDNLKSYGDMINIPSAYLMLIFAAVIILLTILCLLFFTLISAED